MRQQRPGARLVKGIWALLAALAFSGFGSSGRAQPADTPEELNPADDWPALQELMSLPPWMQLQLSVTAEPLFNPLGGERSTANWIQQGTLSLELSPGLAKPNTSWREFDHWQLNVMVNHDAGDADYNSAIGALFPLQQVAFPAGFYLTEVSVERQRGAGWLTVKAGILPINPDFVEVPALDNYVHSAFNNTLNISVADLPINPYAALGAVVTAHASPELSLRYGLFDLSSSAPLSRWLGLNAGSLGANTGTAQFLQLDLAPSALRAKPLKTRSAPRSAQLSAPRSVRNQLPDGLLSLGGFATSNNGNGVYGSLTLPSGLALGLDDRLWIGGSYSPDSRMDIAPSFVGGGLLIQGAVPGRPLDLVVLAIGRSGLSSDLSRSSYEGMVELGYRIQINESLNLQPTLQWILNPSGAETAVADILAAGVQLQLNF